MGADLLPKKLPRAGVVVHQQAGLRPAGMQRDKLLLGLEATQGQEGGGAPSFC
jgi:hypothetical protein